MLNGEKEIWPMRKIWRNHLFYKREEKEKRKWMTGLEFSIVMKVLGGW